MTYPRTPSGRPSVDEISPFHIRFLEQIETDDIVAELEKLTAESQEILESVPADRENHAYAPGKWTVRQVVGHVIDAERIFCVRVLAASRGDQGELPPFDENTYAINAGHERVPLAELVDEFRTVRKATLQLLSRLDADQWKRTALIRGHRQSARAVAWSIAGHSIHHFRFMKRHYL